jgi:hypothetical protein
MKIFISYRRDDTAGYAGRLFDHLSAHFGPKNVFMDIDTIEPGDDFRKVVRNAVGSCDVVLVMIGKQWLDMADSRGNRRLDNPKDWVRVEISTALSDPDVRVIPVLVRGASMPDELDLPDDLKELSWRNALELSDSRFQHDANKLIEAVEQTPRQEGIPPGRAQSHPEGTKYRGIILGSVVLGGIAVALLTFYSNQLLPGLFQTATPTVMATFTPAAVTETLPPIKPTVTLTPGSAAPVILGVQTIRTGDVPKQVITANINFSDPDGDASLVKYELVTTTVTSGLRYASDIIPTSADRQKAGAVLPITWNCDGSGYTATFNAVIVDLAGNQSNKFPVTFDCR